MVAYPVPAIAGTSAGKDVKAGFKPIVKSLSYLDSLMQGVIGWLHAICNFLTAIDGEVGVELDHRGFWFHRVRAIDLNFVVVLTPCRKRTGDHCEEKAAVTEHELKNNSKD